MARSTESQFANAVESILQDRPNREATIAELIDEIPNRMTLTAEDLAQSPTRPNEPVWHQSVRNITSHHASHEGRLVPIPGGLALA